jgi:uncharacterized protein YbjT (DUF2867 family)
MQILVTGATGTIGSKLVPRLVDEGHQVNCIAREPRRLDHHNWQEVKIIKADVLNLESIRQALQGIDVAYYLIHSMAGGKRGFIQRDEVSARNFGTAARDAGVQRIIYLGGLGQCEKFISPHLDSRQQVGDILRNSGVAVTEFRAPIVIGTGSMSFEMIRYLNERLPVLFTPMWIDTLCQPIAIENILEYLITSLYEPLSINAIFEVGGPDVLTYKDIMKEYAAARGLKRLFITIPFLSPAILALGADVITPLPTGYLQILIEGLRTEVIVHDPSAQEVFKMKLIPYSLAVKQALKRDGSGEVERFWAGAQVELQPGMTHKDSEGMFIEQRRTAIKAPHEIVFSIFERIGGKQGWYYANWLWKLRGWLDELVGGVGMRRGRRDPTHLEEGDFLDGWRVDKVETNRLIRLWFEMKAPGPAWLQFEAQPRIDGDTLLILTAFFEPHGIAGLFYWYILYPFHLLIFKGISHFILQQAESSSQPKSSIPE